MFPPHTTQLRDVWLSKLALSDHPDFRPDQNVRYAIGLATRVELPATDAVPPDDCPLAHLDLAVTWHDEDDAGAETPGPFDLAISVTGCFELEGGDLDPDELTSWIELNATHLLWTHARAYLTAVTSFTRHPPLTLFTVRVPDLSALDAETGDFGAITPE